MSDSRPSLLSPEWFERIRPVFPDGARVAPALTVERHASVDGAAGATTVHHQLFDDDGRLFGWFPGPAAAPDLRIHEGQGEHATYVLGDGVSRDVFGLPLLPWSYDGLGIGSVWCRVHVVCGATPEGVVERVIETEDTRILVRSAARAPARDASGRAQSHIGSRRDVRVNASYPALLDWLHGDGLLGHLIEDEFIVHGSLYRMSLVDGLLAVTQKRYACDPTEVALLARHAAAREHPQTTYALGYCGRLGR